MSFFSIMNFDLDIFGFQCVSIGNAVMTFLSKILIAVIAIVILSLIHLVYVLVMYNGAFGRRLPSLVNAAGTITFAFFITVVTAAVGPMRCQMHPNMKQTAQLYNTILCWDSPEHTSMV